MITTVEDLKRFKNWRKKMEYWPLCILVWAEKSLSSLFGSELHWLLSHAMILIKRTKLYLKKIEKFVKKISLRAPIERLIIQLDWPWIMTCLIFLLVGN